MIAGQVQGSAEEKISVLIISSRLILIYVTCRPSEMTLSLLLLYQRRTDYDNHRRLSVCRHSSLLSSVADSARVWSNFYSRLGPVDKIEFVACRSNQNPMIASFISTAVFTLAMRLQLSPNTAVARPFHQLWRLIAEKTCSGGRCKPGVPNQGSMDPLGSMTISQGVHGRI